MVTAWGTTSSALTQVILYYFNPRSRVGNDEVKEAIQTTSQISIHVPAWGTTHVQRLRPVNYAVFQSTFPRGERPSLPSKILITFNFNPRSRVGNDKVNDEWLTEGTGFQSTFPRGERPNATKSSELPCQFQSTFPRGERPTQMRNNDANHDFNPRSRVGNDCK